VRRIAPTACALLALAAPLALAGTGSRQTASYQLSEQSPSRSTAEHFSFDYVNPDDPEAKPPAVRRVVTILPRGARYDARAPASCTASDAELTATGGDACPAKSAIGGGVITVDTGVPGPGRIVTSDTEFFNNATDPDGEFIYLNTVRGTGARVIVRADVKRRRTVTNASLLPGTPPDGGSIDTVDVTVAEVSRRVDGELRRYMTTPRRCPERGSWLTRVRFTYEDDVTQTVRDQTPCRQG
jgi:hypothetical protein